MCLFLNSEIGFDSPQGDSKVSIKATLGLHLLDKVCTTTKNQTQSETRTLEGERKHTLVPSDAALIV